MKIKIILLFTIFICVFFLLQCKKHTNNNSKPPNNIQESLIKPKSAKEIGHVKEHIIDICKWGDAIFLSPYLKYHTGKVYIVTPNNKIQIENINSGTVESVYRVWVGNDNNVYATTEQPPMLLKRINNKWRRITKFANHGWGVCGNMTFDRTMWYGWSYRNQNTHLFKNNISFPSLGNRIVWWVENYNNTYYAGTSSTTTYKNANDGRIYKWNGDKWDNILNNIGGAIVLFNYNNQLFVGTGHPQSILRLSNGKWDRWDFSQTGEISKFWIDSSNRLFTLTTENNKVHIKQFYNNKWVDVWSINAKSDKWGPQGVNIDSNKILIIFWDKNISRLWEIDY